LNRFLRFQSSSNSEDNRFEYFFKSKQNELTKKEFLKIIVNIKATLFMQLLLLEDLVFEKSKSFKISNKKMNRIFSITILLGLFCCLKAANNIYDVIVIGGGVSGLSTMATLAGQFNITNTLLIEGSDRLGGRILTIPFGNDSHIEIGAQVMFYKLNISYFYIVNVKN
jgi:hypothetical protein